MIEDEKNSKNLLKIFLNPPTYILIFGLYFRKMKVKITVIMIPRKILASIENRHA